MYHKLASEIHAYANAIDAATDRDRVAQNLTDLLKFIRKYHRILKGG